MVTIICTSLIKSSFISICLIFFIKTYLFKKCVFFIGRAFLKACDRRYA